MGNDLTVVQAVRQAMDKMRPELSSVLPAHLPVEMFVRITQTALQQSVDLQQCSPRSIIAAATKCAEAGLQPDGEEGAMVAYNVKVKFKNEHGLMVETWEKQAKFLPMVRGIRNQVMRSGVVKDWKVRLVYSQDKFSHVDGDEERLIHEPAYVEGDYPILVYSIAYLENGEISRHVMRMDTVEKIRARSRSKDNGPWATDKPEMIKKTCLKQHSKSLPKAKEDLAHQRNQVMLKALDEAEGVVDTLPSHTPDLPRLSAHEAATARLRAAAEDTAFDEVEDGEVEQPVEQPPKRAAPKRKSPADRLAEAEAGRQERMGNAQQPARPAAAKPASSSRPSSPAPSTSSASSAPAAAASHKGVEIISQEGVTAESLDLVEEDDGRDYRYEAESQDVSEDPAPPAGFRDEAAAAESFGEVGETPVRAAFREGWNARFATKTRMPPRTFTDGTVVAAWLKGYDSGQNAIQLGNQPGTQAASKIACDNLIARFYP